MYIELKEPGLVLETALHVVMAPNKRNGMSKKNGPPCSTAFVAVAFSRRTREGGYYPVVDTRAYFPLYVIRNTSTLLVP